MHASSERAPFSLINTNLLEFLGQVSFPNIINRNVSNANICTCSRKSLFLSKFQHAPNLSATVYYSDRFITAFERKASVVRRDISSASSNISRKCIATEKILRAARRWKRQREREREREREKDLWVVAREEQRSRPRDDLFITWLIWTKDLDDKYSTFTKISNATCPG